MIIPKPFDNTKVSCELLLARGRLIDVYSEIC